MVCVCVCDRLVLRCRQDARSRFAKMRSDVLVKLELLDNKHGIYSFTFTLLLIYCSEFCFVTCCSISFNAFTLLVSSALLNITLQEFPRVFLRPLMPVICLINLMTACGCRGTYLFVGTNLIHDFTAVTCSVKLAFFREIRLFP